MESMQTTGCGKMDIFSNKSEILNKNEAKSGSLQLPPGFFCPFFILFHYAVKTVDGLILLL